MLLLLKLLYADENYLKISTSPKKYMYSILYNPRAPPFDIHGDLIGQEVFFRDKIWVHSIEEVNNP